MAGKSNLFSRFAFTAGKDGKADNATRAFLSKFTGRIGPSIPSLSSDATWPQIAVAANALIKEFVAQGWIKKGFDADGATLSSAIRAVTMIPAATEWGYAPYEVLRDLVTDGVEILSTENAYSAYDPYQWSIEAQAAVKAGRPGGLKCDWRASLDALQAQLLNAKLVNLFVTWFGDDLRCGSCRLYPAVTQTVAGTVPDDWSVNGIGRGVAQTISLNNGGVAFGGTPADKSVVDAIADLKARKLSVAFTPFILMDIPAGNTLPHPDNGAAGQPVYPWRGRITKDFATADKTPQIAAEVAQFAAQYRVFVLHYANLCASAGGVDVFILGTELRGLTFLRDAYGSHPFVGVLKRLAAEVKAILPGAKLTYAADWSEWFGHQPSDGSGDVTFHLDPLWSDSNIDAVAFDNYWPLSDWRDGGGGLDGVPGRAITDMDYLMGNVRGGEGYDWYYASSADRTAQQRTPIADGAYGKPWVFRYKDVTSWWTNRHFNRPGGVESATPTDWVPQSKPVWFTELGVPSIDKGTNQPNVFYDPKSSESAVPYFSSGVNDYLIQRRGLLAQLRSFEEKDPEFTEDRNPVSAVYGGRMIDLARVMVYTWDARPYPAFPSYSSVWSDAPNWPFGHWLNGKLSSFALKGELNSMPLATTYAPRHPYIVDPATGKLDPQYKAFFEGIEFVQGDAIAALPLQPTAAEAAAAINAVIAVLRAQKRIV